jgi:hypothetical protein
MILFLILSVVIIATFHSFVMRSVESYDKYGESASAKEQWKMFERERLNV